MQNIHLQKYIYTHTKLTCTIMPLILFGFNNIRLSMLLHSSQQSFSRTQRQSREWANSRKEPSRCPLSFWLFFMFPSTYVILYREQSKTFPNKLSQTFFFQQLSSPLWHFFGTALAQDICCFIYHLTVIAAPSTLSIRFSIPHEPDQNNIKGNQQPR